jgi:hypothetical protein
MYKLCRHIRTSGGRCRAAALPAQHFCHYHLTQRKSTSAVEYGSAAVAPLELPPIEDRFSVQIAIGRVLSALASGAIDPRHAGLFLYGIQIAASNLPHDTDALIPSSGAVRRVVLTRQNEQVAEAETVVEENDTKGHKKSCDCNACNCTETDDPHHPECTCGECHYFTEETGGSQEEDQFPSRENRVEAPGFSPVNSIAMEGASAPVTS